MTTEEDYYCGGLHDVKIGLGEEEGEYNLYILNTTNKNSYLLILLFFFNVLLGDVANRTEGYVEISEGSYSWPYSFTIPASAPLSHIDEAVEVLYTLSAVVDAPEMPIATSQVSISSVLLVWY